jgi:hypothetical protein
VTIKDVTQAEAVQEGIDDGYSPDFQRFESRRAKVGHGDRLQIVAIKESNRGEANRNLLKLFGGLNHPRITCHTGIQ